jgi:hypothetical protein
LYLSFLSLGFWWSGSWICFLAWGGRGGRTAVAGGGEREREREKKSETGQAAGDKKKKKTKDFYHCFFLYNKK